MRIICQDQVSSTAVIDELLPTIMKELEQHFLIPGVVVKINNNDLKDVSCVPADESSVRIHLSYRVNEGFIFIYLDEMAAKLRLEARAIEEKGAAGLLKFPIDKRALNKRTNSQAEEGELSIVELDSAVKNLNHAVANANANANAAAAEVRIEAVEDKAAVTISLKHPRLVLKSNEACFTAFEQFADLKTNFKVNKLLLSWEKAVSEYNHEYEILILEGQKIRNLAINVSGLALHMCGMVKKVEGICTEAQFMEICKPINDNVERLLSGNRFHFLPSPTSVVALDVDGGASMPAALTSPTRPH